MDVGLISKEGQRLWGGGFLCPCALFSAVLKRVGIDYVRSWLPAKLPLSLSVCMRVCLCFPVDCISKLI